MTLPNARWDSSNRQTMVACLFEKPDRRADFRAARGATERARPTAGYAAGSVNGLLADLIAVRVKSAAQTHAIDRDADGYGDAIQDL